MTVHFSFRVDISAPNPIAAAEAQAKAAGIALGKLNDSNPTRHGLAPALVPSVYTADPRGPRHARESLATFLSEGCVAEAGSRAAESGNGPAPSAGRQGADSSESKKETSTDPTADAKFPAVAADDLYLLSSTSEAYSWLIKLLCDPGDAVLAPKPGYPLIESIARLEGVETVEYQLQFDGSWFIDTASIAELLDSAEGSRIRALVLINPNNPSGSYVKPSEREALVRLCREHGIALIADEVFYDYSLEPFPGNARLAGEPGVLTFALDGFSKMLAAPHAKVGWIQVSGPSEDVAEAKRRLDVIADDYLPMSDIIATMIPDLLAAAPGQTARTAERVRGNLARLHELLDADPNGLVSVLRAEGGWNVLLRVPSVIDENELVLRLITDHQLTGQPGYFFDMESNGYLAVSLLPEPGEFERNIRAVLDTVAALLDC
ncbi:pyridoxal phosphate-dependent aminotransferase [Bifidobacterium miconisargentati]|uniref:pyridoxal phosphate-dependent aminotransferase n=1 Tax=Bifidobacterium miconisargentati TaxID=2834437 RepID=UPI001BDBEBF1|nr:pyridoxal phosphate-dependent aminotransferase [Bifidobacterium miconisargentati]MBW3089352.1 pyridoxal phosphate-dependent aminotransferase [Bifidobacterium miconisargentati]